MAFPHLLFRLTEKRLNSSVLLLLFLLLVPPGVAEADNPHRLAFHPEWRFWPRTNNFHQTYAACELADGGLLIKGSLGLFKFSPTGAEDLRFREIAKPLSNSHPVRVLSNGKILLLDHTWGGNAPAERLRLIEATGIEDESFRPELPPGTRILAADETSQGAILVAYEREFYTEFGLARLGLDGRRDPSFTPDPEVAWAVRKIIPLTNGKTLLMLVHQLVQIDSNGRLDTTFQPSSEITHPFDCARGSDGKVYVSGDFGVRRLNSDGSDDPGFSRLSVRADILHAMPDGSLIVADNVGHTLRRFLPDGIVDANAFWLLPRWTRVGGAFGMADGSLVLYGYLGGTTSYADGPGAHSLVRGRFHEYSHLLQPTFLGFSPLEAEKQAAIRLTRSGKVGDSLRSRLAVKGNGFSGDVTVLPSELVFEPNQLSADAIVTWPDDGSRDTDKFIELWLEAAPEVLSTAISLTVREDDEDFRLWTTSAAEQDGAVRLIVQRPTTFPIACSVDFFTTDGSATAGQDYVSTAGTLVYGPTDEFRELIVPLLNDGLVEPTERFRITLTNASPGVSLNPTNFEAFAFIADNERGYSIKFDQGELWVVLQEGASNFITIKREGDFDFSSELEVTIGEASGEPTALAGADYVSFKTNVIFSPGVGSITLPVHAPRDGIAEPTEFFIIGLRPTQADGIPLPEQTADVWIEDDDLYPAVVTDRRLAFSPIEAHALRTGYLFVRKAEGFEWQGASGEIAPHFKLPQLDFGVAYEQNGGYLTPSATLSEVHRFDSNGVFVAAFGEPVDRESELLAMPDGSVLVETIGGLARFLPDGTKDPAFSKVYPGADWRFTDFAPGEAGFFYAASESANTGESAILRFALDGRPDEGFAPALAGKHTLAFSDHLGRPHVLTNDDTRTRHGLVRLLPSGSLDPAFTPINFDYSRVLLLGSHSGQIYSVARLSQKRLEIFRYLPSGIPDPLCPSVTVTLDGRLSLFEQFRLEFEEWSPNRIAITGNFLTANGYPRPGFVEVEWPSDPAYVALHPQSAGAYETNGAIPLILTRRNTASRLALSYHTEDGTARAGLDYHAASGTVVFEPGQGRAEIPIEYIDNHHVADAKAYALLLRDAASGQLLPALSVGIQNDDLGLLLIPSRQSPEQIHLKLTGRVQGYWRRLYYSFDLLEWHPGEFIESDKPFRGDIWAANRFFRVLDE